MPTYNGWNVVTAPASPAPKSVKPSLEYIAGAAQNPFTGQQQIQDWGASYSEMTITMPPMEPADGLAWEAFLISCKGIVNVFQLPTSISSLLPAGIAPGGYWRLKANSWEWSINDGIIHGLVIEIREAI
jgi:hypothetical protein